MQQPADANWTAIDFYAKHTWKFHTRGIHSQWLTEYHIYVLSISDKEIFLGVLGVNGRVMPFMFIFYKFFGHIYTHTLLLFFQTLKMAVQFEYSALGKWTVEGGIKHTIRALSLPSPPRESCTTCCRPSSPTRMRWPSFSITLEARTRPPRRK